MHIETLLGPLDEDTLTKEISEADIPVGKAITTRYFFENELVRQDTLIEVTQAPAIGATGGLFPKG